MRSLSMILTRTHEAPKSCVRDEGKEHDYRIVRRRFLKDYRKCRVCKHKEIIDYTCDYREGEYLEMKKNYYIYSEKAKKYDVVKQKIIDSFEDNAYLLKELLDLNEFVGTDGLVELLLLNNINRFDNDLNNFLQTYVDLLNVNVEKAIRKNK